MEESPILIEELDKSMSLTNSTAVDPQENLVQNTQYTSQDDRNINPSSTKRPAEHELSQPTSLTIQNDMLSPDPKKAKYGKGEGFFDKNEGLLHRFSVGTRGKNVSANILDCTIHTSDGDMKSGQMGGVADGQDICSIATLKPPSHNIVAAENEGVTTDADVNHDSFLVRNPSYTEENARRETYRNWPSAKNQRIESLVDAGLFYTGDDDHVRCFHCDIGFAEWSDDDDPWTEHARHSPDCPYLRHRKGKEFISGIQAQWSKVYSPKHQEYTDTMTRYRTYGSSWPSEHVLQTPEQLADAGFLYTGTGDVVRCHYCDGGLREWEPEDDPWIEHAKWFPFCKFVLKKKGFEFVQAATQNASCEEEDFEEEMLSSNAKEIGSCTVRADAVWSLENRPRLDKLEFLDFNNPSASWKNILQGDDDKDSMDNEDIPGDEMQMFQMECTDGTTAGDKDEQVDTDPTFNILQMENTRRKEQLKCKICHEGEIWFVFIPCRHLVACIQCGEKVLSCTDCNANIEQKRKIYLV